MPCSGIHADNDKITMITETPMLSTSLPGAAGGVAEGLYLLCDQEHINSAQIEVVIKRQTRQTFISWVLASVQL